jgi:hypothetical protein
MIQKPRVLGIDGGAYFAETESTARVSDEVDAESKGDRSVGVASCDDMLPSAGACISMERTSGRHKIAGAVVLHG